MRKPDRATRANRRLRRRLSDQQGMALAFALAILLVLGITATALMAWSSSNFRSATHTRVWEGTLLAAEGGIDEALATLNAVPDPNVPTLLPTTTTTLEDVSVSYSGSYDPVFRRWTVTSTATAPGATGGADPVSRTVQQILQVRSGPATVSDNPAWGYIYADGSTGCTVLNSGVQIRQPVFVRNSLCLNNNVLIYAAAGTVQVGGGDGITVGGSAMIGVADDGITPAPIDELWVDNKGCRYGSGGTYAFPCSGLPKPAGQQVSATNQYATIENISKPPIDLTARYYDAAPGPAYPCGPGSAGLPANYFDTNTVVNDVSAGRRELLPNFDYTCTVPGLGTLAWDYKPSGPGTLTIDGTVFIDGDAVFPNNARAVVNGSGTIYASGTIQFEPKSQVCGKWDASTASCDWANWDPNTNNLFLAAGHQAGNTTLILDSNVHFQGGLWANQNLYVASTTIAQGPMVTTTLVYNSAAASTIIPPTDLPPGAPANPTYTVVPIPGSWREL